VGGCLLPDASFLAFFQPPPGHLAPPADRPHYNVTTLLRGGSAQTALSRGNEGGFLLEQGSGGGKSRSVPAPMYWFARDAPETLPHTPLPSRTLEHPATCWDGLAYRRTALPASAHQPQPAQQ